MPLNLRNAGMDGAVASKRAEATVEDLERELAERRAEAEAARVLAEREAKEDAARRRQAQRDAAARVAQLEAAAEAAIAEAERLAGEVPVPAHHTRVLARSLLLGTLRGGEETGGPHSLLLAQDQVATLLWDSNQAAAGLLGWMVNEGVAGEVVTRADAAEVKLWGQFMRRLRVLAGEV